MIGVGRRGCPALIKVLLVGVLDRRLALLAGDGRVDLGGDRVALLLAGVAADLLRAATLEAVGGAALVVGLRELGARRTRGAGDRERREVSRPRVLRRGAGLRGRRDRAGGRSGRDG